jgi:tetratricopeptide (TPR) repeat protein
MLKPKKKFTKRELKEDKFVTATFKTQAYLQENWQMVLGVVAATVVVLLLIVWTFNNYYEEKSEAGTLVTEAEISLQQGQRSEAINKLKSVVENYSNDQAGYGGFLLGTALMQEGLMDSAGYYFSKAIEYTDDPAIVGPAYMNLGSIEYADKNYTGAADFFLQAYEASSVDDLRAEALLNAAIADNKAGSAGKAKKLLNKLLDEYPDSEFARQAKTELAMLDVK